MSYLTVHEVATLLKVSDLTVRRWIGSGRLPATRIGRLVRIRQADLENLAQPVVEAAPDAPRPGSAAAWLTRDE